MLSVPWPQVVHLLRNLLGSAQLDADSVVSSVREKHYADAGALAADVARTSRLASEVLRVVEHIDATSSVSIDLAAWVCVLQCLDERFRIENVQPSNRRVIVPAPSFAAGRALIEAVGAGPGLVATSTTPGVVELRSEAPVRDARALTAATVALGAAGIAAICTSLRPCVVSLGPSPVPTTRDAASQRSKGSGTRNKGSEADGTHVRRRARRV